MTNQKPFSLTTVLYVLNYLLFVVIVDIHGEEPINDFNILLILFFCHPSIFDYITTVG